MFWGLFKPCVFINGNDFIEFCIFAWKPVGYNNDNNTTLAMETIAVLPPVTQWQFY